MSTSPRISMRDWRRRPALRLKVTEKLHWHWCWVHCDHHMCRHKAVIAIVPYVIRWGPDDWASMLRQYGRCTRCGRRQVKLLMPSWGGAEQRWVVVPYDQMAPVPTLEWAAASGRGTGHGSIQ